MKSAQTVHLMKPRAFGPDLIRATAILLVLWSHTFPGGTLFPALGVARIFLGRVGVEIFFLLSGYLIGDILQNELFAGRWNQVTGMLVFWKRRWFRTLPNYYLFLGLNLLLFHFVAGHWPTAGRQYFWFGEALWWPHPGFFVVAWTLAIEEWFYLLFPLLLFVIFKLIRRAQATLLLAMLIFVGLPVALRCFIQPAIGWDPTEGSTLPNLDAIVYGVALAYIKFNLPKAWKWLVKIWFVGMMAMIGILFLFCSHFVAAGFETTASLYYRACGSILVSATLLLMFPKVAETNPPANWTWLGLAIRKISLWSYSIYLSHFTIRWLVNLGFEHCGVTPVFQHTLAPVLIWLFSITVSAFLYHYFERPVMDLREQLVAAMAKWA